MITATSTYQQIQNWYEAFRIHLIKMGLKLGYREDEINDLIHQFYLDLLEKNVNTLSISNPGAYLSVAFKRKLIDYHRKHGKSTLINADDMIDEMQIPSIQETLEQVQTNAELIAKIRAAYQKLPPRCQKVIDLKFYKGFNTQQIAAQTGLSERTVYNNMFEGIKLLRIELNKTSPAMHLAALLSLLPLVVSESILQIF